MGEHAGDDRRVETDPVTRDTGYRGIWSSRGSLETGEPWRYVHYSGGLGTAFQQHTGRLDVAAHGDTYDWINFLPARFRFAHQALERIVFGNRVARRNITGIVGLP